jgi:hypothetical protein
VWAGIKRTKGSKNNARTARTEDTADVFCPEAEGAQPSAEWHSVKAESGIVFAPKPEGAMGFSPGFQPWEPSKQTVRPERARDAYTFDLCCGRRLICCPFRVRRRGPGFPGLKPRAEPSRPLRGEEASQILLNFAPFNPGLRPRLKVKSAA